MSKEFEDGIDQAILDHLKDRFEISENMLAGKNDLAWALIFDKYDVCEKIQHTGEFEISASTINMFREARLMAKFDHYNNLPEIFKKVQNIYSSQFTGYIYTIYGRCLSQIQGY